MNNVRGHRRGELARQVGCRVTCAGEVGDTPGPDEQMYRLGAAPSVGVKAHRKHGPKHAVSLRRSLLWSDACNVQSTAKAPELLTPRCATKRRLNARWLMRLACPL